MLYHRDTAVGMEPYHSITALLQLLLEAREGLCGNTCKYVNTTTPTQENKTDERKQNHKRVTRQMSVNKITNVHMLKKLRWLTGRVGDGAKYLVVVLLRRYVHVRHDRGHLPRKAASSGASHYRH